MKKLFDTNTNTPANDWAILLGRIGIASLMLLHGLPKMQALFSGDPIQFPSVLGMSAALSLTLAVFAEVFCSLLILAGFGTRLATIPLAITMMVAAFSIHATDVFAKKELAVLYLVGYITLFISGSGRYSVDHVVAAKRVTSDHPQIKTEDPSLSVYQ